MKLKGALVMVTAAGTALVGCQEVEEPKTVLTQQQWKEVEGHILSEAPDPEYELGINFGDKVELIGFDVDGPIRAGQKVTVTWYWKALAEMKKDWRVFVHLDSKAKPIRQNLDHHPVEGLYRTSRWKKGQIIEDIHTVRMRKDYPAGEAVPHIGLYSGKGVAGRLPIKGEAEKTKDRRVVGPTLTVEGGAGQKAQKKNKKANPTNTPRYAVRKLQEVEPTIDGELDEDVWAELPPARLQPFGKGQRYQTWAKLFATDEALYVGAYLQDEHIWGDLDERDADTWTQEVLELFIDPEGDGKDYVELQITPKNTIFDARFAQRLGQGEGSRRAQIDAAKAWNMKGLESAVSVQGTLNDDSDEDRAWTVELKLPFAALPHKKDGAPAPGQSWAFNLYRFDRPAPKKSFAYAWSTAPRGDFHQVDKFGQLRFVPTIEGRLKRDLSRRAVAPEGADIKIDPKLRERLELRDEIKRGRVPTPEGGGE